MAGFEKIECPLHGRGWHYNERCCACHPPKKDGDIKRSKQIEVETRDPLNLSEEKTLTLRQRWQDRTDDTRHHSDPAVTRRARIHLEDLFEDRLAGKRSGPEKANNDYTPEATSCSFCGKPVDHTSATRGKASGIRVTQEVVTLSDGTVTLEDKIRATSQDLMACPDCSLKIKPNQLRWAPGTDEI